MEGPDEYPMATRGPLSDIREGFTPPTDPRGSGNNPAFMMITSIDNGQVVNATTNELMAPNFGNCC